MSLAEGGAFFPDRYILTRVYTTLLISQISIISLPESSRCISNCENWTESLMDIATAFFFTEALAMNICGNMQYWNIEVLCEAK